MKTGYLWVFWLTLALMVITAVIALEVTTDHSLFRATPVLYSLVLITTGTGLGLMMRNRFQLPVLRNLRIKGKLLLSPLSLFLLSAPAAIIYIFYDISGKESLSLLSALFMSIASVFFLVFMFFISLPAMGAVLHFLKERCGSEAKARQLSARTITAIVLLFLIVILVKWFTGLRLPGMILVIPMSALVIIIPAIILSSEFRHALSVKLSVRSQPGTIAEKPVIPEGQVSQVKGFRSTLLFADHYLDLVSGRINYLINHADEDYAAEVVAAGGRRLDPALLPALRIIVTESRFSDHLRESAAIVVGNIEKYYSDPARNIELLRRPGISERSAAARAIMLSGRQPQVQEIAKMLSDESPEIRRTGLIITGKYGISQLRAEVMQSLVNHDTARDAFYVLREFGPEVFSGIIGNSIRATNSETENLMIMRLLEMMPLSESLQYLNRFITSGHLTVRLKAVGYLCRKGFVPQGKQRQQFEAILDEMVHTVARLITLGVEAKRARHFVLAAAIDRDRSVYTGMIFDLITVLYGRSMAELIRSCTGDGTECGAAVAAETIESTVDGSLRKPLRALLGNHTDSSRVAELTHCYPLRQIRGRSVASFILASEQNITGSWTKACALHKVSQEGSGLDRELAVSYLFSNSQLLQEESARAIRAVNPDWYLDAEARLQGPARNRISAIISGSVPDATLLFEKTRFLSLCFNGIPEEKSVLLASSVRYSEGYDAESIPGVISWIVPSNNGRSGLYSLAVSDIDDFVFYYSEYTDIFVHYIDNQGIVAV